ncbi:hypothetical protein EMCRGX_G019644 [Ephydatia muelleri]
MNHSRSVRSTSEAEAKGELASLLTGVFVVTKVLTSVRLNCTATSGCSKDKIDALRETLDVYKKFQNALDTLLGVASDQGLTDGISETDWIRKYVICKGTVAQATVSTVAHLYPSLNVTHSC